MIDEARPCITEKMLAFGACVKRRRCLRGHPRATGSVRRQTRDRHEESGNAVNPKWFQKQKAFLKAA